MGNHRGGGLVDRQNVFGVEAADHDQSRCRDLAKSWPGRWDLGLLAWILRSQCPAVHLEKEVTSWPDHTSFVGGRTIEPHSGFQPIDLSNVTGRLGRLDLGIELGRWASHEIWVWRTAYGGTDEYQPRHPVRAPEGKIDGSLAAH